MPVVDAFGCDLAACPWISGRVKLDFAGAHSKNRETFDSGYGSGSGNGAKFGTSVQQTRVDAIEAAQRAVDMPLRLDNANALPHTHSRSRSSKKRLDF